MAIWKYIEILRKPNKIFLLSKDNTKEKIDALNQIMEYGSPSDISSLVFLLGNKNREVRESICNTVIHLFKKIKNKKEYYNILKYCDISMSNIINYTKTFEPKQLAYLLAIGTLNHNGYVRELSVSELSKVADDKTLQFIIYRLGDWVNPVRNSAEKALLNYKKIEHLESLINNLATIEWLQQVGRIDLENIYREFIEFIIITNRDYTISNFKKYPDKLRLLIAKHISSSLKNPTELKLILEDKLFLIRSLALSHFEHLGEPSVIQLLNDRSGKVRLNTLYKLKGRETFKDIIKDFLADTSSTIRHLARFILKDNNLNFADFYYSKLQEEKQVLGALLGLAEINAQQYSNVVETYLFSEQMKVRKTAFFALTKLNNERAYKYAIENLDTQSIGLRHTIIDFLSDNSDEDVLIKARECYEKGDIELKMSMLNLFRTVGGWKTLADLMLASIDGNTYVRNNAKQCIDAWKISASTLYSTPSNRDLIRIKEIYVIANNTHKREQYFSKNPLDELDFYFR